jgi:hypothetical protein
MSTDEPARSLVEGETLVDPDAPVLVTPPELVLDEAAALRMARQLVAAAESVVGIVAPRGELRPGSSARTAAERAAMLPADVVEESMVQDTMGIDVDGAVLLRPGVPFEVRPTTVHVERGPLLVDRGSFSYDPWLSQGALQPADAEARPPFRWRPVVLFLGLEPDLDLAETARALANGVTAREVEARLALPELPDGSYLTRPCRPNAESVRALDPDVIVALDPSALAVASDWCGANRSTTVVELTQDITFDVELVSWRVGEAQGRLRARIGRGIGPGPLAELANRLASGPQPVPPDRDRPYEGVHGRRVSISRGRVASRSGAPSVLAVTAAGSPTGAHLSSVLDELAIAGTVHRAAADSVDADLVESTTLVIVSSSVDAKVACDLEARRHRAGRPTLLDVEVRDVVDVESLATTEPLGAIDVAGLAGLARAVAPSRAIADALRSRGMHTLVLPHLLARLPMLELERAAEVREAPAHPVIGWWIGDDGLPPDAALDAVSRLALELVGEGVRLEVRGNEDHVPAALRESTGVSILPRDPTSEQLAAWTVQMWTPPTGWADVAGDVRAVAAAGLAGVPTVLDGADRKACSGLADQGLVVGEADGADGWAVLVRRLLGDEDQRGRRSRRARDAAHTIYGAEANRLRADRLMGWALQHRGG